MKNQTKLFTSGLKPVFKIVKRDGTVVRDWKRLLTQVKFSYDDEQDLFTVRWQHNFAYDQSYLTYFAYSYPYSFEECTWKLSQLEESMRGRESVYTHWETIVYSLEGRPMEMLTVSSTDGLSPHEGDYEQHLTNLFPEEG